jgi:hypothetical protein
VILKKELDYELLSSYHLVLQVSDQGQENILSTSTAVFIQVIPLPLTAANYACAYHAFCRIKKCVH